MKNNLQIAIDGPVGSGKGTLAVALAKKLNATHIYSGGMYRALALASKRAGIDLNDPSQVYDILKKSEIDMSIEEGSSLTRIFLNEEDVSEEIFLSEISNITPIVAAHAIIRSEMVKRQKELTKGKRIIIEGRDIATNVLPNADVKIYLTADIDERSRRRFEQLKAKRVNITLDKVKKDIIERDEKDTSRKSSPMVISEDSLVVDTTHDTIEDTVGKVLNELRRKDLL